MAINENDLTKKQFRFLRNFFLLIIPKNHKLYVLNELIFRISAHVGI